MEIKRVGSEPSGKGPSEWFTGTVRIDPLYSPVAPARAAGNAVTFEPGARTAWHTHPLGQTLIFTFGSGWAQREGGPIEEIGAGFDNEVAGIAADLELSTSVGEDGNGVDLDGRDWLDGEEGIGAGDVSESVGDEDRVISGIGALDVDQGVAEGCG